MNRKVYAVIFAIILLLLPFQIMHPYNRNPNVNISGNNVIRPYNSDTFRVIGQNGTTDIYRIQQNLTVSSGSTLEFLNTHVEFLPGSGENYSITVFGRLILMNSSISLDDPGSSEIFLFINGGEAANRTGLEMVNSTLDFNGVIDASNTTLRIYNSTTRTPFSDPNLSNEDLRYSFSNTTLYTVNSNLSGMETHGQDGEYLSGGLNWNNEPVENSSRIVFPSEWVLKPDALTNIISVTIGYGIGNTTSGSNLTFSLFGKPIYTYYYPAHNGTEDSVVKHFNISIMNDPQIPDTFNSSYNFSVYQHLVINQVFLDSINITFLSNDTVSLLGRNNFGIYLRNSTWISYNDSFSLNMVPYYVYADVPNPEKNAIFLEDNSSLYAVGMKISPDIPGAFTPVYTTGNSRVFYFSIFSVKQKNQFGELLNAGNNITSSSLNPDMQNITCLWNGRISSMIRQLDGSENIYGQNMELKRFILLDSFQNESNKVEFTGDYEDRTLGSVYYFSLQPMEHFNFTGQLNMVYTDPYPVLNITAGDMIAGSANQVNISIGSQQGSSNLTVIKVMLSNNSNSPITVAVEPMVVNQGTVFMQTVNISPSSHMYTGVYRLTLYVVENQGFANNSIWEFHRDILIYSTTGLSTGLNYTEEPNKTLRANVTVHGISPCMEGDSMISFILENNGVILEERNISVIYSGVSTESFHYTLTDYRNATEMTSFVYVPFPGTGKESRSLQSYAFIRQPPPEIIPDYRVILHGIGITGGEMWHIYNGTSTYASVNGNISLDIPNGTYFFSIKNPSGFISNESSIAFTVNGTGISLGVRFTRIEYRLEIIEVGLNANTSWRVQMNNITMETSRNFIRLEIYPGNYTLVFTSVGFYSPERHHIMINISASPVVVVENFSYTGGFTGIVEEHPAYTLATLGISVLALLYYMDIRKRSYFPCLSCGTTWPRKRKICPGCGRRMNGKNQDMGESINKKQ